MLQYESSMVPISCKNWNWYIKKMLNWIVWNRTDYLYKNGFGVQYPTKVDMP